MTDRARVVAAIAGVSVIALAILIRFLASASDGPEPPVVGRGFASAVLLGAPGIIGLLGAWTRRGTVLAAAAVVCLLQSAVSFSGVTLVYLVPALVLLRSATEGSSAPAPVPIRPIRLLLAAVLAVPLVVVVFRVGILALALASAVAVVVSSRTRGARVPPLRARDAARGAAIVVLVVAAWVASFSLAETTCWLGHSAPGGGIAWERIPPSDTFTLGPEDLVATCAGGTLTPAGVVLSGMLLLAAFGMAALPVPRGGINAAPMPAPPASP